MKRYVVAPRFFALAVCCLAALGCNQSSAPQFRLNMIQMAVNETNEDYQEEIANVLAGMFGTPDEPFALPETGLDQTRLDLAAGPAWSDEQGVNRGLYRKHCVHCHGVSGDGKGPTALFLNPYPRDYRKGVFKFKTTYNAAKPTDDDLHRVLNNGVPGTSMPAFSLLFSSEREALVEYVKYLAIRGEMETRLADYVFNELGDEEVEGENGEVALKRIAFNPGGDADQRDAVMEILAEVMEPWQAAGENVIVPEEDAIPEDERTPDEIAASIDKGRELFYGPKANCVKCHGPTALGDGQRTDYDVWNKEVVEFVTGTEGMERSITEEAAQDDLSDEDRADLARRRELLAERQQILNMLFPARNAIPRNLRAGVYRGGIRRRDIFCRVHAGIAGTPMPGVGAASPGGQGTLTEVEIWNIVDYVLSLPYEAPSTPLPELDVNPEAIIN
ncbi:MAG: c-type cytochrome [Planctomycetales bacterium]|nr:c-type cytochrome [Planctomycetales bacterium]